jgi:hypothetical protein
MIKADKGEVELEGLVVQLMAESVAIVQRIAVMINETAGPALAEGMKQTLSDLLIDVIYLDPEEHRKKMQEDIMFDLFENAVKAKRGADDETGTED